MCLRRAPCRYLHNVRAHRCPPCVCENRPPPSPRNLSHTPMETGGKENTRARYESSRFFARHRTPHARRPLIAEKINRFANERRSRAANTLATRGERAFNLPRVPASSFTSRGLYALYITAIYLSGPAQEPPRLSLFLRKARARGRNGLADRRKLCHTHDTMSGGYKLSRFHVRSN